ncbi:unnamed protein product [Acanthoscelides obtectus]|uniref:Uncharacterized protein n=1 Tax=Acanthoscelides obtectus TaxID=200917 RepID=A0A9P0LYB9_ACAOB|nr:unnamed protein product [Acanthoscelides obtectus]CAK1686123.1 hypothetical protein AOBTE_LOCUS35797 [Acanthoscelides obtectus]
MEGGNAISSAKPRRPVESPRRFYSLVTIFIFRVNSDDTVNEPVGILHYKLFWHLLLSVPFFGAARVLAWHF